MLLVRGEYERDVYKSLLVGPPESAAPLNSPHWVRHWMSLEWVKRRVLVSGGFVFFDSSPPLAASLLGKPHL
jgi:hypothetical protein